MSSYQAKYIKYKQKYIILKTQLGGACPADPIWDDKKPFVSSKVIPEIEIKNGPYSITPKNYKSTETYNPPAIIKAYNSINTRIEKLNDFIKEREDRIAKITTAKTQSTSCNWGADAFVNKLDKQLIKEQKELDDKNALLIETNDEHTKLELAERTLIDTYLATINDENFSKKLQKYKDYQASIQTVYPTNTKYLQDKINNINNILQDELNLIKQQLNSEENLDTLLSKVTELKSSVKFDPSKKYLEDLELNLSTDINKKKCDIIDNYIHIIWKKHTNSLVPNTKSPSGDPLISKKYKNHFLKHDNDTVKDFRLLLANTNLKPSFILPLSFIGSATELLNENILNTYTTETLAKIFNTLEQCPSS